VIAGVLGGRRFAAPRGRETRPTSDRVREALFAALEPVTGARVLDLYAGSGALAIEALSRGAAHAVLVERAPAALAVLRANLRSLGLEAVSVVIAAPLPRALDAAARAGPFDLVLADPPYGALGAARDVLSSLLDRPGALEPRGRLVLEHAARDRAPDLAGACVARTRRYGDTAVSFYAIASAEAPRR
jgi:16S rRNA (guanine966-N2)-methyltransferase